MKPVRAESSALLAVRSLAWMLLMPGVVAGYVPWRFFGVAHAGVRFDAVSIAGNALIAMGIVLLIACVWEFAHRGRGTLSPVDPPRELVVNGLYRYVRNPMYLAVSAILIGEALIVRSTALTAYWAVFFLCANAFIMGFEEPDLRRRFGASYDDYVSRVGRWIPSFSKH